MSLGITWEFNFQSVQRFIYTRTRHLTWILVGGLQAFDIKVEGWPGEPRAVGSCAVGSRPERRGVERKCNTQTSNRETEPSPPMRAREGGGGIGVVHTVVGAVLAEKTDVWLSASCSRCVFCLAPHICLSFCFPFLFCVDGDCSEYRVASAGWAGKRK